MPDKTQKRSSSVELHAVVDRIEDNDIAVVLLGDDEKTSVDIPLALLPEEAIDGAHLRIRITLDGDSRKSAETHIKDLQDKLQKKSGTKDQKNFKL